MDKTVQLVRRHAMKQWSPGAGGWRECAPSDASCPFSRPNSGICCPGYVFEVVSIETDLG